jgi:hydroxyethylthiazole kinase-like sugar kinase family protein
MKNLPEQIYLNFGELSEEDYENYDYKEAQKEEWEITWCEDPVFTGDQKYIREDTVKKMIEDAMTEYEIKRNLESALEK